MHMYKREDFGEKTIKATKRANQQWLIFAPDNYDHTFNRMEMEGIK